MRNLQTNAETSANGHAAVDSITDVPLPLPSTSSLPSISSLITLLADVQTKLIQHHQLQQSQLHRSRIRRTEYATSLQTLLQQVEEQAKKRNRVQLSSFLKQEMRRREMESAKFEQRIVKGLEMKWERVFEKLMDGLEGILDEAKCEESEWNGLVRRIVMEEQTRSNDEELLVMLRDAGRAWKTEDQAEESWRNAWETTNLTLERLSQRVQQPSSSQAGSGSQSFHHRRGHATITAADSEDGYETDEIPNRRQSVIQTRRRELEGSISTSTSVSTSTSISTSAISTSTSITTPMSDPPIPISISLSKPSFELLPSLPNQNVEEQQPSHHPYSPSLTKREYAYSPITNQIPGQELFDESLERISPDAGFAYAQSQSHAANENGVPGDGLHPSSAANSKTKEGTSSSSTTGGPGTRSPLNRVKKSTSKIKIQTELAIDNEEEQKPSGELGHPSSSSIRSPKSSSAARPSSQTQTQTQIRRTASIKRTSSNTSMKTTGGGSLRITASTTSTSVNTSTTASVLVSGPGSGSASVSGKWTPSSPSAKKRNKDATPSDETKSPLSKTENNATTSAYLSSPSSTPTQSLSSPLSPATALAWKEYETRWRTLKSVSGLTFSNIPWPLVLGANGNTTQTILDVEAIDPQLVSEFILFNPHPEQQQQDHYHQPFSISGPGPGSATSTLTSNWAKKRIRSALLRWHPDRFNATILKNVVKSDRKAVQDGVGKVVRILNEMLVKEGGGVVGDIST